MNRVLARCLVILLIGSGATAIFARPASAEWFLDAYGGASFTADADVSIRDDVTVDDTIKFDTELMGGGRLGYWLEGLRWLGVAGDISYFAPAGEGTTPRPISEAGMRRWAPRTTNGSLARSARISDR
jgi:hypothetical protein